MVKKESFSRMSHGQKSQSQEMSHGQERVMVKKEFTFFY
jgi:hypothetical protein